MRTGMSSEAFIRGHQEAERQWREQENTGKDFDNPYKEGTDEHDGFEAAVYTLTQK
jgi:hypothetical protein